MQHLFKIPPRIQYVSTKEYEIVQSTGFISMEAVKATAVKVICLYTALVVLDVRPVLGERRG